MPRATTKAQGAYIVTAAGEAAQLAWPLDPAVVRRCLAGEPIPEDERGPLCTPAAGERVDPPPTSIAWLLEDGLIVPAALEEVA